MKKTFNQNLFLKKSRSESVTAGMVYVRVTIDGCRTDISTQRQCERKKWNADAGRMKGKTEEVREFNSYLETVEFRIYEIHKQLVAAGKEVTGQAIKDEFLSVSERPRQLVEIFEHHNAQFAELVGKEYSAGTLKRYKSCLASIKKFLLWKYERSDIDLKQVTFEFINDYEFYLKTVQQIQHNTAMGNIKKLKKIIRQCVAKDWLPKDPFANYKMKMKETNRVYLLEDELEKLMNKEIMVERLAIVRDIFLFSCFSGLAYADVAKLTPADIATGIDGEKWIFTTRTKTDTSSRIPLLPTTLYIIEKYQHHPKVKQSGKLLPMLSNQRMNSYLKELASVCDINKELTFHCARHTFATTVTLTNGVPIESVSKMLGHKNLRTTQHYAKILDRKVSEDMGVLKEKFSRKEKSIGIKREFGG